MQEPTVQASCLQDCKSLLRCKSCTLEVYIRGVAAYGRGHAGPGHKVAPRLRIQFLKPYPLHHRLFLHSKHETVKVCSTPLGSRRLRDAGGRVDRIIACCLPHASFQALGNQRPIIKPGMRAGWSAPSHMAHSQLRPREATVLTLAMLWQHQLLCRRQGHTLPLRF